MVPKRSFIDILISQGVLSADQVTEAKKLAKASNKKLQDAILTLGYASGEEITRALAQERGLDFIDLHEVVIRHRSSSWSLNRSPVKTRSCQWPKGKTRRLRVIVSDPRTSIHSISCGSFSIARSKLPWPRAKTSSRHQPPLRSNGRSRRRLDAPGIHRYGHRFHGNRARIQSRRRGRRRNSAPIMRLMQLLISEAVIAGLGYPCRAVRKPGRSATG